MSHACICVCFPALETADSDNGLCGWLLVGLSILLMLVTLPISIWMCIKVSYSSSCIQCLEIVCMQPSNAIYCVFI